MKKILALLFLALSLSLNAQLISVAPQVYGVQSYSLDLTNGFNRISTSPIEIQQLQIVAGGTNVTLNLYDNQYGTRSWTNSAYTGISSYTTNLTLLYTNAQGIVSTNTVTGGNWRYSTSVDAATVTQSPVVTLSAPANGIATYNGRFDFSKGVTVFLTPTNTSATLNIQYRRLY